MRHFVVVGMMVAIATISCDHGATTYNGGAPMARNRFDSDSSTIADAQREMRHVYFGGAPGVLASALAWTVATVVCYQLSPAKAIWALFIGGMLIHPVAVLMVKAMGRPGSHTPGNPLGALAMATTIWMILCLPLAYAASMVRIEWFFPGMLCVIGGRYLTFATIFGSRIYWVFGAVLGLAAWQLAKANAEPVYGAAAGAAIEAGFAMVIFVTARREVAPAALAPSAAG